MEKKPIEKESWTGNNIYIQFQNNKTKSIGRGVVIVNIERIYITYDMI